MNYFDCMGGLLKNLMSFLTDTFVHMVPSISTYHFELFHFFIGDFRGIWSAPFSPLCCGGNSNFLILSNILPSVSSAIVQSSGCFFPSSISLKYLIPLWHLLFNKLSRCKHSPHSHVSPALQWPATRSQTFQNTGCTLSTSAP